MSNPVNFNPKTSILTILQQQMFRSYGWIFLIFTALLAGCGPAQVVDQSPVSTAVLPEVASVPTATPSPAPASAPTEPDPGSEAAVVGPTEANSAGDALSPPELTAKIGNITFATDATDQHEPINAGLLFPKGITQVHAMFDYSGMSTAYTWERVWYLNDKEVSRKSGVWTGPDSGVFDYFIDNGGRPLPPGDWVLEIYVEGKLLSLGAFVIENSEEAQPNGQ
ncbi:MAG: hypothetical protein HYR94_29660 [Chloroflexi bacterium]|nr:hypothetical protein [Chloroflexota bacterium]